ncbi:hypothetical protein A2763_00735 [Candidatus Kaiserbacteria bacterium RIFCSPHIGHO2_01_FULL_54_36]|uniref:Uncharacterized protein n=1 Tax=Candidatus Kaiserbacteria bacterium RIFCSPHIGHO2_01_FULL_54_36 TaxID=1798482 RepID=A0A1F6CNY2_9BACT|nr:MAG: hypothetical protein A2763_00735 [Candidatus Kaiserbacteria bacterium RIFCSPHIGHO2_01_FULL_54_36]OGG75554.1 MAG: hypothetical protein A3A41_02940 [Candidatus Kaiserbacteria bacterium RIFCSPLOWO2_01_FULL_54_22]
MGFFTRLIGRGLFKATALLIGFAGAAGLFVVDPKKYAVAVKLNQEYIGTWIAWLLGKLPHVGAHLEAFLATHSPGFTLLVVEVAVLAKLIMLGSRLCFRLTPPRRD